MAKVFVNIPRDVSLERTIYLRYLKIRFTSNVTIDLGRDAFFLKQFLSTSTKPLC